MVYVWTGLTQALGLTYYGIPGIDVPPNVGFQYREPDEERRLHEGGRIRPADRRPDRLPLQRLAAARLVGCPRPGPARHLSQQPGPGQGRHGDAAVFHGPGARRTRCCGPSRGTVSAIAGIFKAPFDILADKLRGYLGLVMDMHDPAGQGAGRLRGTDAAPAPRGPDHRRPDRSRARRLLDAPRLRALRHHEPVPVALLADAEADHRGALGARASDAVLCRGQLERPPGIFAELPDQSIVYHVDRGDIFDVHRKIGHKFCLSGGIPNFLLSYGTPAEVRANCKQGASKASPRDGGYIMDAGAIMQNDTASRTCGR